MSLEEALNRNSDLLEKHNDLLTKVLAGGKAPAAASAASAAPADKPAASAASAASAAAGKPAAKPATKPAAAAAKKTPSVTMISERFGAYMKAGDTDEREAAKANVRSLVAHYGAPKLTEIDPAHFPRLLEYLDGWEAGSEVEFDELGSSDGGEDEEGAGLL